MKKYFKEVLEIWEFFGFLLLCLGILFVFISVGYIIPKLIVGLIGFPEWVIYVLAVFIMTLLGPFLILIIRLVFGNDKD
jgi:hypothetical protein